VFFLYFRGLKNGETAPSATKACNGQSQPAVVAAEKPIKSNGGKYILWPLCRGTYFFNVLFH
jgi:hypothetical protein